MRTAHAAAVVIDLADRPVGAIALRRRQGLEPLLVELHDLVGNDQMVLRLIVELDYLRDKKIIGLPSTAG